MGGFGISLTLIALSPDFIADEKLGRWDWETLLCARDLSCSDRLKPPSPGRADGKSDVVLGFDCVLACAFGEISPLDLGPAGIVGKEDEVVYEGVLPEVPGLPPLFVRARRACAPNDMRRANGVVGLLRPGPSSSSMALSSIESERSVETLPRRPPNAKEAVCVGDVPDNPRVEIDILRRWS